MIDSALLGPWVRRFLLEHLVGERGLARNTQQSYRDTLRLLLPFTAERAGKAIDRLTVEDRECGSIAGLPDGTGREAGLRREHAQPASGSGPLPGARDRPA